MESVIKAVDVNVPVTVAYNQWTQFEDFPLFMENVEHVEQVDDTRLNWSVTIGGKKETWSAEITEQIPDARIAWRSTGGVNHSGVVTFHRLDDETSRVTVQTDYEPDSMGEKVGAALGVVERRIEHDLEAFKKFIEKRGKETGAWRGKVDTHAS